MYQSGEWQMASIMGLDDDTVEKVCMDVKNGFVVPANYNCTRSSCYFRREGSSSFGYGKG